MLRKLVMGKIIKLGFKYFFNYVYILFLVFVIVFLIRRVKYYGGNEVREGDGI